MSEDTKHPKFGDLVSNPLMRVEGLYLGETGKTWQYMDNPAYPMQREWYILITKPGTYGTPWPMGSIQCVYWSSDE